MTITVLVLRNLCSKCYHVFRHHGTRARPRCHIYAFAAAPGFARRGITVRFIKSLQGTLEGLRRCRPESGCQGGTWCMRDEGHQGGCLCSVLESNLRLTHSLPSGWRETRFRLLWVCCAITNFLFQPPREDFFLLPSGELPLPRY